MSGVILSGEEYVITVVLTSGFSYFYALFPEVSYLDTNDLHTFSHICHSSGSDYVQEVQSFLPVRLQFPGVPWLCDHVSIWPSACFL